MWLHKISVKGIDVPARSAGGKQRWQWVSPTLSKPDIGKGLFQAVQFMRTKASGYPSWPGVADSTEGRIHWRRPTAIIRISLATLQRTIHSDKRVDQALRFVRSFDPRQGQKV